MVSEVTESNSEEECPQEERRAQRMTAAIGIIAPRFIPAKRILRGW